jgi:hypothetical protein
VENLLDDEDFKNVLRLRASIDILNTLPFVGEENIDTLNVETHKELKITKLPKDGDNSNQ